MKDFLPPLRVRRGSIEIARSGRDVIVSNIYHKGGLLVEQADFSDFVAVVLEALQPPSDDT